MAAAQRSFKGGNHTSRRTEGVGERAACHSDEHMGSTGFTVKKEHSLMSTIMRRFEQERTISYVGRILKTREHVIPPECLMRERTEKGWGGDWGRIKRSSHRRRRTRDVTEQKKGAKKRKKKKLTFESKFADWDLLFFGFSGKFVAASVDPSRPRGKK